MDCVEICLVALIFAGICITAYGLIKYRPRKKYFFSQDEFTEQWAKDLIQRSRKQLEGKELITDLPQIDWSKRELYDTNGMSLTEKINAIDWQNRIQP